MSQLGPFHNGNVYYKILFLKFAAINFLMWTVHPSTFKTLFRNLKHVLFCGSFSQWKFLFRISLSKFCLNFKIKISNVKRPLDVNSEIEPNSESERAKLLHWPTEWQSWRLSSGWTCGHSVQTSPQDSVQEAPSLEHCACHMARSSAAVECLLYWHNNHTLKQCNQW